MVILPYIGPMGFSRSVVWEAMLDGPIQPAGHGAPVTRYGLDGRRDDEVEAAKARDRKAYELHGEYAYLNFPEDFER
jgi:hypothetical protein